MERTGPPERVAWLWPSWPGLALDVVVAGLVASFSLGGAVYGPAGPLLSSRAGDVAIAAVGSAALLLRRRFPLPVAVISGAASIAVVTAPLLQVAGLYTLASCARSRRDHIVAGGVIVLAAATYSIALRLWADSSAAWATAFLRAPAGCGRPLRGQQAGPEREPAGESDKAGAGAGAARPAGPDGGASSHSP